MKFLQKSAFCESSLEGTISSNISVGSSSGVYVFCVWKYTKKSFSAKLRGILS